MSVQLPSNENILDFCRLYYRSGARTVVYPSYDAPIAFIKIVQSGVESEIANQKFAFNALEALHEQERAGIRVPKIYRVLEAASTRYIIMEFPYNAAPRPIGGGIIRHPLFKDTIASIEYPSVDLLQSHIKALANMPRTNSLDINFRNEDLCFCYSDLFEGNFIFTNEGDLYVVDFEHASVLPASFITYALDQPRPAYIAIKNNISLPYENLEAMKVARHNFTIRSRKAVKAYLYAILTFRL
ncbi:hypothetical protein VTL71DRAFT_11795 [Oculimacula yallundae]|uniref:Aminoglycoside phosphotransferase domain-containing protein n=1 Tax=Oculimacula yallundae TaxID=86028 RepID=A0ABR4CSA1_9HELO